MSPAGFPPGRRFPLGLLLAGAGLAAVAGACGSGERRPPESQAAPARGRRLVEQRGCLTCHSTDGSAGAGPTWKDLAGSRVRLTDGRSVVADHAYLARAILDPDAETVAGYRRGVMAGAIPGRLSEDEVAAIVAYLESL